MLLEVPTFRASIVDHPEQQEEAISKVQNSSLRAANVLYRLVSMGALLRPRHNVLLLGLLLGI